MLDLTISKNPTKNTLMCTSMLHMYTVYCQTDLKFFSSVFQYRTGKKWREQSPYYAPLRASAARQFALPLPHKGSRRLMRFQS